MFFSIQIFEKFQIVKNDGQTLLTTRVLCSFSGFGIAVAKTEKPIKIWRSMNSCITHLNTRLVNCIKNRYVSEITKILIPRKRILTIKNKISTAPVQLTRNFHISISFNVLLDATSPLPNYIFVSETISDADAEMLFAPYRKHCDRITLVGCWMIEWYRINRRIIMYDRST